MGFPHRYRHLTYYRECELIVKLWFLLFQFLGDQFLIQNCFVQKKYVVDILKCYLYDFAMIGLSCLSRYSDNMIWRNFEKICFHFFKFL